MYIVFTYIEVDLIMDYKGGPIKPFSLLGLGQSHFNR